MGIDQQKKHHQDIIKLSLAEIAQELENYDLNRKAEIATDLNPSNSFKDLEPSISEKINEILAFQDSLIKENNFEISKNSTTRNIELKKLFNDFSSLIFVGSLEGKISKKEFEKLITRVLNKNEIHADFKYSVFNENW